jgi:uncharacterized protein (DUF2141 family)
LQLHVPGRHYHGGEVAAYPALGANTATSHRSRKRQLGETNLTKRHSATLGVLLLAVTGVAVSAETDLTGKWLGQFNGVQIAVPVRPSGFGYLSGEPTRTKGPPKFVEATLQIEIETQKKDLAVGTWSAGEFKQQFVCAQTSRTLWNCVDAGGRSTLEVTSASEIKVCYFDNREGAQGAGCALLQRTHS